MRIVSALSPPLYLAEKQAELGSVTMVAAATTIFSTYDVLASFPTVYEALLWPDPLPDLWL